jgi:hypothetical protein
MCRPRYAFISTFASGLLLAQAALAGINFVGAETINVAPKPQYMVTGDLNNDGLTDVVTVSPASKEVDVYVAADNTTFFAPAQAIHFGNTLRGAAIGDLNNDGRADVVVSDQAADAVWILLGRGDGTFLTPYLQDVPNSRNVTSVAIGQFDSAGNMDLAVGDERVNRVFVLINDNGTPPRFRRGGEIEAGLQPIQVLAVDMTGDGQADLVTLNVGGPRVKDVSVIPWKRVTQGFPEFDTPKKAIVGEKPSDLLVADFNNDGKPDVAMLNRPAGGGNSEIDVLLNDGSGTLFPPQILTVPCPFFTGGSPCKALTMTVGDFDGNGDVDLMVALSDPRRSRGSASSLADSMQAFGGRGDGSFVPGGVFATQKAPVSMGVGDFTGDGTPDIVVAAQRTLDLQAFVNTSSAGGGGNGDECLLGEECLSSRCIDGICCAAQCALGERCNVPGREGICVPIPPTPTTCALPDNPCAKHCVSSTNEGAECVRNTDCPGGSCEGLFCVNDFCCDQECVGGRCNVPGFIGVCVPGLEPGVECNADEECVTGFCSVENHVCCREACEGGFCNPEGICESRKPNGAPCDVDGQPIDDLCLSTVCDDFDLICCNRRCSQDERCFEVSGECVPLGFTPSPTPTKSSTPTPTTAPTRRLTPGGPGESCSVDDECTTPFCTDDVCCMTDTCPTNEHCGEAGLCVVGPPTPTPTVTALPTLPTTPTVNPCGSCPSGTRCKNGLCVSTSSGGGCSTVGDEPAAGNLIAVALLPLGLWLSRRWQLRRVRVRSRAPRQ